jgi:hypothetical protein
MGKGSQWIAASGEGGENNRFGSCKAHHVGISPQEDRGGAASEVGEVQSSEEGKVKDRDYPGTVVDLLFENPQSHSKNGCL